MLDPTVFADEAPVTNAERLLEFRARFAAWKAAQWLRFLDHGRDATELDDLRWLPECLRRQGE